MGADFGVHQRHWYKKPFWRYCAWAKTPEVRHGPMLRGFGRGVQRKDTCQRVVSGAAFWGVLRVQAFASGAPLGNVARGFAGCGSFWLDLRVG